MEEQKQNVQLDPTVAAALRKMKEQIDKELAEFMDMNTVKLTMPDRTVGKIEGTPKIYSAIPAVMADMGIVAKDKTGKEIGYKYRSIDDVYNALKPALAKNKVFILPTIQDIKKENVGKTKYGAVIVKSTLRILFTIYAEDGSYVQTTLYGESHDMSDKGLNKAMAIAYKYLCFQIFCIPTEDMDDPDAEKIEPVPDKKEEAVKAEKKTPAKAEKKTAPKTTTKASPKPAEKADPKPAEEEAPAENVTITQAMINTLKSEQQRTGVPDSVILSIRGVKAKKIEDLNVEEFKAIMKKFEKTPDKKGA